MKRNWKLCLLILAVILAVTGCSTEQKAENGYTVYCVNATGTRLIENSYRPQAGTFDEMLEELISQLRTAPSGYFSVLPEKIRFNGFERGIDALRVDFSEEYYELTNIEEVLLRAAIVKTVCQIPGVTKVMITVNGQQLLDSEGELVPAMDANTFIDTKEGGINSYQYASLELYFANRSGSKVEKETRSLHYSSNMVLERVVVEQLISGPQTSGLAPILTKDVSIQNIYTQNGVCTITFSDAAEKNPSENSLSAEAALYAIVNSICETCDYISGVKFEINGDTDGKFRGEVELNQIFMMNPNVVDQDVIQSAGGSNEVQPEAAEAEVQKESEDSKEGQDSSLEQVTEAMAPAQSELQESEQQTESKPREIIAGKPIAGVDPALAEE